MKKPFIHLIQINKDIYLLDINTNMICKVNEKIGDFLLNHYDEDGKGLSKEDHQLISNMKRAGMLKPNAIQTIEHPMTNFAEDMLENNLSRITLQVTQNCNLRCAYCVYSGSYNNRMHNNKRMDVQTAKKALDFLKKHSKNSNSINVSFYGGEPVLEFQLITECVEYAKKIFDGKELMFNLTTNATLLNDEMIYFFQKEGFYLTISLDGPEKVHDKNRDFADGVHGTYSTVMKNLKRITEIAPNYLSRITFNAVLDDENNFELTNDFFMNEPIVKNMHVSASYINDVNKKEKKEYMNEENYINRGYKMFVGMMFLLGRVSRNNISKLVVRDLGDISEKIVKREILKEGILPISHPAGPCLPGFQRPFVDAYGKLYPCERINETSDCICIGNIETGFDINTVKKLLNVGKIAESYCKKCWAFNYCTQCAVTADEGKGLSSTSRLEKCERIKLYIETALKDYIVLKECGCKFEEDI